MAKTLNTGNFEQEVLKSEQAVLVDFWADWCGPCKRQAPALDELTGEGYAVGKVNIDENPQLASEYGVMSIPTLVIFKAGKEQRRLVGVQTKEVLKTALDQA